MSATPQWTLTRRPTAWTARKATSRRHGHRARGARLSLSDTPFPATSDELGEEIPPDSPRRGPSVFPRRSTGPIPGSVVRRRTGRRQPDPVLMEPDELVRLRDAAPALEVAASSHPNEFDLDEARALQTRPRMRARHSTTSRSATVVFGAVSSPMPLNAAATGAIWRPSSTPAGTGDGRSTGRSGLAGCVSQAALEAGMKAARRSEE